MATVKIEKNIEGCRTYNERTRGGLERLVTDVVSDDDHEMLQRLVTRGYDARHHLGTALLAQAMGCIAVLVNSGATLTHAKCYSDGSIYDRNKPLKTQGSRYVTNYVILLCLIRGYIIKDALSRVSEEFGLKACEWRLSVQDVENVLDDSQNCECLLLSCNTQWLGSPHAMFFAMKLKSIQVMEKFLLEMYDINAQIPDALLGRYHSRNSKIRTALYCLVKDAPDQLQYNISLIQYMLNMGASVDYTCAPMNVRSSLRDIIGGSKILKEAIVLPEKVVEPFLYH